MPWQKGKVKLADGTTYPAELLVENGNEVWNVKIHKGNNVIEEIHSDSFTAELRKSPEEVYPFSYEFNDK